MTWPVWYTCQKCPPHGMSDHSMYGDRACLIVGCTCKGYKADESKPIKRLKKGTPMENPLPQRPV